MYIEHAMYCCSKEFFQIPNAVQHITDTVFTEVMDPYRLKTALNILTIDSMYYCIVWCVLCMVLRVSALSSSNYIFCPKCEPSV